MNTDNELRDFRALMARGLELAKIEGESKRKCVIYVDVQTKQFFCGKVKNSKTAEIYNISEFSDVNVVGDDMVITFGDRQLVLFVNSTQVRNYLIRMFKRLFASE
jgi:hypothetical protein